MFIFPHKHITYRQVTLIFYVVAVHLKRQYTSNNVIRILKNNYVIWFNSGNI